MIPWFHISASDSGIQPFGLLMLLGLALGIAVFVVEGSRRKMSAPTLAIAAVLGILLGVAFAHAGARYVFWLKYGDAAPGLGFNIVPGMFGMAFGVLIASRVGRASPMDLLDSLGLALPWGIFVGRLGCFVVHDHPGRETSFFLGVQDFFVGGNVERVTRHDLGLYGSLTGLGLALILIWVLRRKPAKGVLCGIAATGYALVRFGIEFLQMSPEVGYGGPERYAGLTVTQYECLVLLTVGALTWILSNQKGNHATPGSSVATFD